MELGAHLPVFGPASRARDLAEMVGLYERFAGMVI